MAENNKKVLLSLKDVEVKFNVRGRLLTAIRNVSLDIYENEAIAIVGESGSGKSVLTKTFAGMLDSNGFITNGSIIFNDDEISKTDVQLTKSNLFVLDQARKLVDRASVYERGSNEFNAIQALEQRIKGEKDLTDDEHAEYETELKRVSDRIVDLTNKLGTLTKKYDSEEIVKTKAEIAELTQKKKDLNTNYFNTIKARKEKYNSNPDKVASDKQTLETLKKTRQEKLKTLDNPNNPYGLSDEVIKRNEKIAYEIVLSIGRYPLKTKIAFLTKLRKAFRVACTIGQDLTDEETLNNIFEAAGFRVKFVSFDEENQVLHGYTIIDCAKVKYTNDWQQIRGCRIATVFQDPMTSLNPIITIGKQIMTVIQKHQKCSLEEAKRRALDIMDKVGIPDPEKRFNDYPFQYSGGMRQRIVIAIALSCQPKILICDEPTTALDVTIQAQIIRLIKDLQEQLGFTTVYITHDLGVVANVAERVAVLYAGQIVELGTVEEIFFEPKHPYTWALLSSLPQLSVKGSELFSIPGTPPSLYNKITGDAFAPRSSYAMAIDLVKEPPMFKVSDTHYAKTWLLDPRAPKVEPPENIQNLHEKISKTYVDFTD